MPALILRKFERREEPPRLCRIVVRHRRLQALARRRRLAELAAKPAEQPNRVRARHARILAENRRLPYARRAPID